jgi:hypothetical protein
MGMSGLFDSWAVRVAGVLSWFHSGGDGEFEYWPVGLDSPTIHAVEGDRWEIRDGQSVLCVLGNEDVRVSLLWKALTFADQRAAQIYDSHENDLTLSQIVSIFSADLDRRGLQFETPADLLRDSGWAKVLAGVYMRVA